MAASSGNSATIADWKIEVSADGGLKILKQTGAAAKEADKEIQKLRDNAKKAAADGAAARSTLTKYAAGGIGMGALMVRSHAQAGFQDSLQGQQAQVYGQLMNRQIAAIFVPLLEEKTKYVSQMTNWLAQLREPQRESIRTMAMFTTSMTALGFIVPKITSSLAIFGASTLAAARAERGKAVAAMSPTERAGQAGGMIGTALSIFTSLMMATPQGRQSMVQIAKELEPVLMTFGDAIQAVTPVLVDMAKGVAVATKETKQFFNNIAAAVPDWMKSSPETLGKVSDALMSTSLPGLLIQLGRGQPGSNGPGMSGLSPVPKGFEEITASFDRIVEASTKMDLQQKIADSAESTATNTAGLLDLLKGSPLVSGIGIAKGLLGF